MKDAAVMLRIETVRADSLDEAPDRRESHEEPLKVNLHNIIGNPGESPEESREYPEDMRLSFSVIDVSGTTITHYPCVDCSELHLLLSAEDTLNVVNRGGRISISKTTQAAINHRQHLIDLEKSRRCKTPNQRVGRP